MKLFHHLPSRFLTLSPWEKAGDILVEAAGKAVSWAVMTDVFLLPFGDAGREGLGRERLPRWTALIILPLEEVDQGSPFPMSQFPGSQRAPRKMAHPSLLILPPVGRFPATLGTVQVQGGLD